MPTTAAVSRARVKLGAVPLKALSEQVAKPLAEPATRGSWYRTWRVPAVDGTPFDVPDTPENAGRFGRPGNARSAASGGRAASANGTDLLWRVRANVVLPVRHELPDGSYLSEIVATGDQCRRADPVTVRVVEYTLDDPGRNGHGAPYRLITTILDHRRAPARELAALYCQRWEIETVLDELKTHQRGPGQVLRSRSPDGV
ncbi:transposase, partial [Lentzea sp.]|uniref:transposase n=1 Tax=Lentzea sp. TaxID=56099 RepID=UPI002C0F851F